MKADWHLSADQSRWELHSGSLVVATLAWDRAARTYIDGSGKNVGPRFDQAQAAIEASVRIRKERDNQPL